MRPLSKIQRFINVLLPVVRFGLQGSQRKTLIKYDFGPGEMDYLVAATSDNIRGAIPSSSSECSPGGSTCTIISGRRGLAKPLTPTTTNTATPSNVESNIP